MLGLQLDGKGWVKLFYCYVDCMVFSMAEWGVYNSDVRPPVLYWSEVCCLCEDEMGILRTEIAIV